MTTITKLKLQIPAGKALPSSSLNSLLGPTGININLFCKQFNETTIKLSNLIINIYILIFITKKFKIIYLTPTTNSLIKLYKTSYTNLDNKIYKSISLIKKLDLPTISINSLIKCIKSSSNSFNV